MQNNFFKATAGLLRTLGKAIHYLLFLDIRENKKHHWILRAIGILCWWCLFTLGSLNLLAYIISWLE